MWFRLFCRDVEARHRAQLLENPALKDRWGLMTRNNFISRGTLDSPLAWVELDADAPAKLRKTWKCGDNPFACLVQPKSVHSDC